VRQKSAPLSVRLSLPVDELVTQEARRTRRSKSAVVESLADEALRCRMFPGIAFRGADWARRPWVVGTALDVWEIIRALEDFGAVERLLAESDLGERRLRVALAYYERYRDEVDAAIAEGRRTAEEVIERYPTLRKLEV
jgi:uncharacterized protein (DUF433 family)